MQWAKAKTIMIWLFLAVDIILLTVLAVNKLKTNKDINEHLKVNDSVKVKVVSVAPGGKISLSIKKVQEEEAALKASRPADVEMFTKPSAANLSFEDKISRFKSDSDERLQTLKRNFESKRGSYGSRRQNY